MLVRIYGVHVNRYEEVLETLPDEMIHAVEKAPICKRIGGIRMPVIQNVLWV